MRVPSSDGAAIRRSIPAIDGAKLIFLNWTRSISRIQYDSATSRRQRAKVPGNFTSPRSGSDQQQPAPKAPYMRETIAAVSRLLRYSTWDDAQWQLRDLHNRWDSYTVNQVLKTHPPMEKAWLFFLWASQIRGFRHDHFTYTTMLDIFGEAGRISSMLHLFREMEEEGLRMDAATYTSVVHWLAKAGDLDGSLRMWEEMRSTGCELTVVSYTAFMKVLLDHGRYKEAAAVYRELLQAGLTPTCHTYTVLIEYLAGSGKFNAALGIMNKMQDAGVQPDKATCNIFVQKCAEAGETMAMLLVLEYMRDNSLVLRLPIFLKALETLKIYGESDHLLREVNPHFSSVGMELETPGPVLASDHGTACMDQGIIFYLLTKRNFAAICHMLDGMIPQNITLDKELIAAIIRVSSRYGSLSAALSAFRYGVKLGQKHERITYLSLLGPLIRLNHLHDAPEVIEEMIKQEDSLGTYLSSLLILKLGSSRMPNFAAKIFYSSAIEHDTATYTALIHAFVKSEEIDRGLEVYDGMRKEGIHVSSGTYEVLISGLEEAGRSCEAEYFKKEKKKVLLYEHSRDSSMEETLCDCFFSAG